MAHLFSWKSLLLLAFLEVVTGKRIKDMIYTSIDNVAACFRRHNGTHQFGCSSNRSGSIGAIHFIAHETDLQWLEINSTAGPYVAIMSFPMFTRDTLLRLRNTDNINGILLANTTESRPSHYSPEDTCPNRYSGAKECNDVIPWNPLGSALLMEDWPFPIFFMQDQKALEEIKSCYAKHNAHDLDTQSQRSLCALEMKSFMFAAVDTQTCIRRSLSANIHSTLFCEPLGDRNIHWSLTPTIEKPESVILVTARLDATAMFNGLVPGAGSTITGLVTFLATAYYLNALNATVNSTNVMFTLMNGEAYDYIGSSRMVYDLKEGNFKSFSGKNLDFDQVSTVIDLGQLGPGLLYLHTSNSETSSIVSDLKNSLPAKVLKDSVPPSSVNSFLKAKSNLSTVVIANHGQAFENKYYHSLLDDKESLGDENKLTSSLAKVAISLGNALYKSVTGSPPPKNNEAIEKFISHILPCYLVSANCSLFVAATPPGTVIVDRTLPLYISVKRVDNSATSLTAQLLAFLTGNDVPELNSTTCYKKHLAWMSGNEPNSTGICINATVYFSPAVSPAFIIDGYDMTSGTYSTWTESIWETLSVRMFLKPSAATERFSMALGSSVAILSLIVVWFFNSHAKIIFNTSTEDL